MYDALLFDFDGVLVDTERITFDIWRTYLLEEEGYILDEKWFAGISGSPAFKFPDKLAQTIPCDINVLFEFWEAKMNEFATEEKIPAKPGYGALMYFLKKYPGKKGIVTSNGSTWMKKYMDLLRIEETFDTVINGRMITRHKPEPDIYLLACEKLDVSPEKCLAIEDSESGVSAALAAGVQVVRMKEFPGFSKKLDDKCISRVDDLYELVWFLSKNLRFS